MKLNEITETVNIALDSIKSNKMRSLLASLGVVIGISFVILMGWVLNGLDSVLEDTINTIGQDMIYVDKWDWAGGGRWQDLQQRKDITYEQAVELCNRMTTSELAMPVTRKWGATIKYSNDEYKGINIQGTYSDYGSTPAGDVSEGRFYNKIEDQYSSNVVVLGDGVNKILFPDGGAIGKTIKIQGRNFTVIGVVKKQGTMLMDFIDNQVFIPLSTFLGVFGKYDRSFSIGIKAGSIDRIDEIRAEAEGNMRIIRNIKPGKESDFSINETKSFQEEVATFRFWVWAIGIGMTFLSFLVGIIGIMNIMFVSVAERTKEIGIRKAIGAKKVSILIQFISESAVLSLIGACISFILCSGFIFLVATYLPIYIPETSFLSPVMPYNLLLIASIVSLVVGILAGLIPAMRAANLDPVDALRFE